MAYEEPMAGYEHESFDSEYGQPSEDFEDNLIWSNFTTIDQTSLDVGSHNSSRLAEAVFLFSISGVGIFLNVLVISSVLLCTRLRRLTNAFIVHGGIVDAVRSGLCLLYAIGILRGTTPTDCDTLGTIEVVAISVSMFNLLAMVLTEAYTFHVHNLDEFDTDRRGAVLCILFGVCMVYTAGLIIHLGPTLIGGHFQYAKGVGGCTFRDYVLHAIWMTIVTLTLALIFAYIVKFYKQLKANDNFRLTVLGRSMAAHSKGRIENGTIFDVVHALMRRVKVLAVIGGSFIVCWYPLFFLSLADRHLEQPKVFYKVLTYLAWSQATVAPLLFICFDHSFGVVEGVKQCLGRLHSGRKKRPMAKRENSQQPLTAITRDSSYSVSFHEKLGIRTSEHRPRDSLAVWAPPPMAHPYEPPSNDADDSDGASGLSARVRRSPETHLLYDSDETPC